MNSRYLKINGKQYCIGSPITAQLLSTINIVTEDTEINFPIEIKAKYSQLDDMLKLDLGLIHCKIELSETTPPNINFTEETVMSFNYNCATKEGTCDYSLLYLFATKSKYNTFPSFSIEAEENIDKYLIEVWKNNTRVFDYFSWNNFQKYNIFCNYGNNITTICTPEISRNYSRIKKLNLLKLSTTNLLDIEKLISSNNQDIMQTLFENLDFTFGTGKKLSSIISLPKAVLEYIKENSMESNIVTFQEICSKYDGNTALIIIEMLQKFVVYIDSNATLRNKDSRQRKATFFENILTLLNEGYKITPLLNYLLRQQMYYSDEMFYIPYNVAKEMCDYIKICHDNNLKIEKYPQDLHKTHQITLENINVLNNAENDKKFQEAIKENYYIEPMEIGDYIFMVPTDINSLVQEGNSLHHCIASYTDAIMLNDSHIYFMRHKDTPKTSLVTVELNPKTHEIVEFKENFNKDPDDDNIIKAVNKFSKKIQKLNEPKKETIVEEKEDEE